MTDRLFFALWPDEQLHGMLCTRLPPLASAAGGRPQRPDQWHVTLVFLGGVDRERQASVVAAAEAIDAASFELRLDVLEHWRKPQVLCLAASQVPAAMSSLVQQLRAALCRVGFEPESREFRPHMTLARQVRNAPRIEAFDRIDWPADRFALVRSVTDTAGSRYEPVQWWNLGSRQA